MAKNETAVKKNLFGFGDLNQAYAQYFTGDFYLKSLVKSSEVGVSVSQVSFAPGTRNNWHQHLDGFQILLVTAGEGWYQEKGQKARRLLPGDVVVTHAGVTHWHGATAHSWFSHIAITAGTANWLDPVSDADYAALED